MKMRLKKQFNSLGKKIYSFIIEIGRVVEHFSEGLFKIKIFWKISIIDS